MNRKFIRKLTGVLSALLCVFCVALPAVAATTRSGTEITILLDGATLKSDVSAQIKNDRAIVPMRSIFEALGYTIHWNDATKTVTAQKGNKTISLTVGDELLTVTNNSTSQFYALDAAPYIEDSRTMVPLRAVAEGDGASVDWNSQTRTVTIQSQASLAQEGILPSLVTITTNRTQGSGFILESSGVLVTNCHVMNNATVVSITFSDGTNYMDEVTVLGFDISRDLVLLQINKTNLPALTIGDPDTLSVGSAIRIAGSPGGKKNTITEGSVTEVTDNYILTDAVILQGNSGGVVVNEQGEVVGIPSFSTTSSSGVVRNFSQRSDFIAGTDRSRTYTLAEFTQIYQTAIPPQHLIKTQDGSQVYIDWEMLPNASYYVVMSSDKEDGVYTPVYNPAEGDDVWYWNYPHCFGLTLQGSGIFHQYYKVATVVNGVISAYSEPIEVLVKK